MLLTLLFIQLLATGFMTGLIWFLQVVHYPLFMFVGSPQFVRYEYRHTRRTTLIVAPVMLIEVIAAAALLALSPAGAMSQLAWLGMALLVVIWLSTAALQVPCHRELSRGFARATAQRLGFSNWIRTLAWSARAGTATAMLALQVP